LSPWPVELFLTSLFRRAQQTAAILNTERAVPVFGSMALNEFQLRDTGGGVESLDQGLVRAIGFLNQFRAYHSRVAVVAHNSILSVVRMSLLNAPFETNAQYFANPGQVCVLRYDPGAGDQHWREVAAYLPRI
jgi:broad specificity phosphatase PhoE